jgi:hypothetical protein
MREGREGGKEREEKRGRKKISHKEFDECSFW